MNETNRKNEFGIKYLCLIIALAMIAVTSLCSCANAATEQKEKENENDGGAKTAEPMATAIADSLPEMDFGGYEFTIHVRDQMPHKTDLVSEGENGELINDAVYYRYRTIEERFGMVFDIDDSGDVNATKAQNTIKSGDDEYDLLALHGSTASIFSQSNLILNLYDNISYIDLDAPWWAADIIHNLSAFGRLYSLAGDISHMGLAGTGCLLFNKNLFNDLGIEYPYAAALSGEWTLDRFFSIVTANYADLNGDGLMKMEDDMFGLEIRHDWCFPIALLYCGGDRSVTMDENGVPTLSAYNERTVDIYNKFFDMMGKGATYMHKWDIVGNFPTVTAFRDGRALFYTTYLQDVINHRDLEYEIGILPIPKYSESTPKYYTNVDAGQNVFSIPVTVADVERTNIIIEALAVEGYRSVMPKFYEVALKTKHASDEESAVMIDLIKEGRVYDFGYFNHSIVGELAFVGQRLVNMREPNFTSFYEKNAPSAQKNLDKLEK